MGIHGNYMRSKDPNNRVSGPKYNIVDGIWALKPYYLGPWTLRVFHLILQYCGEINLLNLKA